jgi:hypothetical protein
MMALGNGARYPDGIRRKEKRMSYIYEIEVRQGSVVKRYKAYRVRLMSWGKLAFVPLGMPEDEESILEWDEIRIIRRASHEQI